MSSHLTIHNEERHAMNAKITNETFKNLNNNWDDY